MDLAHFNVWSKLSGINTDGDEDHDLFHNFTLPKKMKFRIVNTVFIWLTSAVQMFGQSNCTLANYQSAYKIPPASFPYFSGGSGITVSVQTNCSTLGNTTYNCGGLPYACSATAWWLNSATQYIRFTFSAPVSGLTILVNGTNQTEVFFFAASSGAISLSNYCTPDFAASAASVTDNAVPANGSIFTVNNSSGATTYTVTHNGLGSGSRVTLLDCIVPASNLPVELVSFKAECVAKNTVKLNWKTASERNNDFFTVERSGNGKNWSAIRNIEAGENSTQAQHYSFIDNADNSGLVYYRLKQTDIDGNYKHSVPVTVRSCNELADEVAIYPNPASEEFTVVGNGIRRLQLFNWSGAEVQSQSHDGIGEAKVNLGALPGGIYFLKVDEKIYRVIKE